MADFSIAYVHKGVERIAFIMADDHRDAYEAFQSMKANGVIGDEVVQIIQAADIQVMRLVKDEGPSK